MPSPRHHKTKNVKLATTLLWSSIAVMGFLAALGWQVTPGAVTPEAPSASSVMSTPLLLPPSPFGSSLDELPISTEEAKPVRVTAQWKAYRNEGAGFQFKYPPTLLAHVISQEPGIELGINLDDSTEDNPVAWDGVFEAQGFIANDYCYDPESNDASYLHFSLNEFVQRLLGCERDPSCPNGDWKIKLTKQPEHIAIDGIPAIRLTVVGSLPSCFGVYNFGEPTNVIYADHEAERTTIIYPATQPLAEAILETFRFIPIER